METLLTLALAALCGICAGVVLGIHLNEYAQRQIAARMWDEIMRKKAHVDDTLAKAETVLDRQKNGGWDVRADR